jgi:hypothetical protein
MVPETMVELLAARFTKYHSFLVAGLLGLARDPPCPGRARYITPLLDISTARYLGVRSIRTK